MFTNRVRQFIAATLQGLPLHLTIEDYDPPAVEFEMEEMRGGRFIAEEMAKGGKVLTSKLTLQGMGAPIMLAIGATDEIILNVRETGKDQDGKAWFTYHTVSGTFKSLKDKTLKMGDKPAQELEIAVRTYMRVEDGVMVVDIDTRTQKFWLNGKDILADARRAALLP